MAPTIGNVNIEPLSNEVLALYLNGSGLNTDEVIQKLRTANISWITEVRKKTGRPGNVVLIIGSRPARGVRQALRRVLLESKRPAAKAPAKKTAKATTAKKTVRGTAFNIASQNTSARLSVVGSEDDKTVIMELSLSILADDLLAFLNNAAMTD